jgi:asparaginyl-tRNA synthetase
MRNEDYDERHLNQFFHCESEIKGTIIDIYPMVEDLVKNLCQTLLCMPNIINLISKNPQASLRRLKDVSEVAIFPKITFDEAVQILCKNGSHNCVINTETGRDITALGENQLAKYLNFFTPFWITHFDRDRVPFYQKPDIDNSNKVINADMLFPKIIDDSFGGEVVGCGQRQDNPEEILDSLKRQGLSFEPYEWYINLRKQPGYGQTSGFGLGIERFLAWALCRSDIKDVIIYPRLKNKITYP